MKPRREEPTKRILACGAWSGERGAALATLGAAGYEVRMLAPAACPLECLFGPPPDLVLLADDPADPWTPAALRLIRRHFSRLPVVVVTADGSIEERLRLDPLQPSCVLVDPLAPEELHAVIAGLRGRTGADATARHA